MSKPQSADEKPGVWDADTPETEEEWIELLWEHVDEFITPGNSSSGNGAARLHLSPFTFPGRTVDHDADPYPYCGHKRNTGSFYRKDSAVFPPGFRDVCSNCMLAFKKYHQHGIAATNTDLYPPTDRYDPDQ